MTVAMLSRASRPANRVQSLLIVAAALGTALLLSMAASALGAVRSGGEATVAMSSMLAFGAGLLAMRWMIGRANTAEAARHGAQALVTEQRRFVVDESGIAVFGASARRRPLALARHHGRWGRGGAAAVLGRRAPRRRDTGPGAGGHRRRSPLRPQAPSPGEGFSRRPALVLRNRSGRPEPLRPAAGPARLRACGPCARRARATGRP